MVPVEGSTLKPAGDELNVPPVSPVRVTGLPEPSEVQYGEPV